MIHLYYGDGKGKTTAACGLALRAAGSGMRVLFAQFMKDGSSSEIKALSSVEGITVMPPAVCYGWYKSMTDEQKAKTKENYSSMIQSVSAKAADYGMIILDEAALAYHYGLLDRSAFINFLTAEKDKREIVLTGRHTESELIKLADYITEMKKEKHPFDSGISARMGIEY